MFTVLYAIARTAGWIAHWKEMIDDPSQRIGRPRQLYTGATERTFVPMELRSWGQLLFENIFTRIRAEREVILSLATFMNWWGQAGAQGA